VLYPTTGANTGAHDASCRGWPRPARPHADTPAAADDVARLPDKVPTPAAASPLCRAATAAAIQPGALQRQVPQLWQRRERLGQRRGTRRAQQAAQLQRAQAAEAGDWAEVDGVEPTERQPLQLRQPAQALLGKERGRAWGRCPIGRGNGGGWVR
jgi:hypothetical protein